MRVILMIVAAAALAGCGGGDRGGSSARLAYYAEGPIKDACLAAGRKAASRQLCGCVQAVANRELSSRDRARAVGFFADPQRAQDARTADGPAADAFWDRYKAFARTAERSCRG
ncbi:hypothetical protein [Shimia ponticola]|uniref:hypothetical protein n=1 Tax=Shimia ponticola TaxID=2582893 RepID=UPI0011BF2C78|nr:hypothetical protein [Shimia ponticola]